MPVGRLFGPKVSAKIHTSLSKTGRYRRSHYGGLFEGLLLVLGGGPCLAAYVLVGTPLKISFLVNLAKYEGHSEMLGATLGTIAPPPYAPN